MKEGETPKEVIPESVVLTIEFKQTGQILVNGPITNEMLSFYMLEKAKDIVKGHNLKLAMQEAQKKVTPTGGIIDFVRKVRF